jgi:hypothetical protein
LSDSVAGPSLHWRLSFSTDEVGQSSFRNFEANVQREMPRLHEQGRVVVERQDNMEKWPLQLYVRTVSVYH